MTQIWEQKEQTICWNVLPGQCHRDNYEMSGLWCDQIMDYGVEADGRLYLAYSCYFPTLRTIPNDTPATLEVRRAREEMPRLRYPGGAVEEYPVRFILDGTLVAESRTNAGVWIRRQFFPAADGRCGLELVTVTAEQAVTLQMPAPKDQVIFHKLGTKGTYVARVRHDCPEQISLLPGDALQYTQGISADIGMTYPPLPAGQEQLQRRYDRIRALCDGALNVDTGIQELDAMTRFAKLRAGESIFETLCGKLHSPGGRTYYAATWCNDQVEYAGPHFAMTGDPWAIEASLNAYRAYVPFMTEDYQPIPCSVIAEGLDIWNGAGDRGDAAMYLYGASLFALYLGDRRVAEELYGPIRWCAEYCLRQTTPEGVIRSDTDELERRIPTDGYANLSTSCLCYGGLMMAAKLAESLGDQKTVDEYRHRGVELKKAIETYFGAELHGYETYRYSRGFDTLRSWICLPLCVGIMDRSAGTVEAMLSSWLWTGEGMLSCEISDENRDSTIWDRSTLYGLKAAFLAGEGDRILEFLLAYCRRRLLGDRVPYAVEAYPEGAKRHLSAESALFVRVITEGLLGLQPEGLTRFSFVPRLPVGMPHLYVEDLNIAGHCWQIRIEQDRWAVEKDHDLWAEGVTDGRRVTME